MPLAALIGLVGEDAAIRLCRFYEGYRIPGIINYLRAKRDAALVDDWLRRGATVAELCAKYGLSQDRVETKIREGIAARQAEIFDEEKK